jgi:hypothetical protein
MRKGMSWSGIVVSAVVLGMIGWLAVTPASFGQS